MASKEPDAVASDDKKGKRGSKFSKLVRSSSFKLGKKEEGAEPKPPSKKNKKQKSKPEVGDEEGDVKPHKPSKASQLVRKLSIGKIYKQGKSSKTPSPTQGSPVLPKASVREDDDRRQGPEGDDFQSLGGDEAGGVDDVGARIPYIEESASQLSSATSQVELASVDGRDARWLLLQLQSGVLSAPPEHGPAPDLTRAESDVVPEKSPAVSEADVRTDTGPENPVEDADRGIGSEAGSTKAVLEPVKYEPEAEKHEPPIGEKHEVVEEEREPIGEKLEVVDREPIGEKLEVVEREPIGEKLEVVEREPIGDKYEVVEERTQVGDQEPQEERPKCAGENFGADVTEANARSRLEYEKARLRREVASGETFGADTPAALMSEAASARAGKQLRGAARSGQAAGAKNIEDDIADLLAEERRSSDRFLRTIEESLDKSTHPAKANEEEAVEEFGDNVDKDDVEAETNSVPEEMKPASVVAPAEKNATAQQSGDKREHLYKILVIGELGTGKTSIIKRYVHQFFSQHYRATIGVDFALKVLNWDTNSIIRLQLWDIAGQERFGNMTRVYYKEAVGAFIVFDVTRAATFDAVVKWKQDLDTKVQLPDGSPIPCVLLANKSCLNRVDRLVLWISQYGACSEPCWLGGGWQHPLAVTLPLRSPE
ncbi:hypothetical protein PR048_012321 [Dryococelus australis]|uniref:Ras-related protein Rab-32 n=1 Tax=Dryococelus australis TaxID=614101 RepID=A0ABQ9HP31_9NEOP|nr:hypothetical protein PR048_012321 [Dryococelus australis]